MKFLTGSMLGILYFCWLMPAVAEDVISVRRMSMDLAADIAKQTVLACRKKGYQISVVVVDRNAIVQVSMRDVHASRFTLQIAEDKANAVILGGVDSGSFRRNRADIKDEMNATQGILLLEGALPIRAAGSLLGAVGVSGAPGGHLDAQCAQQGLDTVQERLDFVE